MNNHTIETKLLSFDEKLALFDAKLNDVANTLNKILSLLEGLEKSSSVMTEHVQFVNNVYDTVKTPFHTMMNSVSYITGTNTDTNVPLLEHTS